MTRSAAEFAALAGPIVRAAGVTNLQRFYEWLAVADYGTRQPVAEAALRLHIEERALEFVALESARIDKTTTWVLTAGDRERERRKQDRAVGALMALARARDHQLDESETGTRLWRDLLENGLGRAQLTDPVRPKLDHTVSAVARAEVRALLSVATGPEEHVRETFPDLYWAALDRVAEAWRSSKGGQADGARTTGDAEHDHRDGL